MITMNWSLVCTFAAIMSAVNPRALEEPDVFEGDMILTPDQKMAALTGGDVDAPLGRGGIKDKRWPGGVVFYEVDTSLGALCWTVGIATHEIGHALGLYHEQSRPDRDDYVTILYENILQGKGNNFKKYDRSSIDSLGTPYDYGSIMHYGPKAFSKNRKPTIVPKQTGVKIGQREKLSKIDAKQMDLMYKEECNGGGGGGGGNGGGESSCVNKLPSCENWYRYCSTHKYVKENCKKTCKVC